MGEHPLVYIGTYTRREPHVDGKGAGIYIFRLNPADGALTRVAVVQGLVNPTFLAFDPAGRRLYAISEIGDPDGGAAAYAIDATSGALTLLNKQSSGGAGPAHLCVDQSGRFLCIANYGAGSVSLLPIEADGRLGPPLYSVHHQGSGPHLERQQGPHAHSINIDPIDRWAIAADLGIDKLLVYRLDRDGGRLLPADPPWTATAPGAGPRHLAFHPSGRFAYVANELDSTVTVYTFDAGAGRLGAVATVSSLPPGDSGANTGAHVAVHPSGRYLYASNRGHDSIAHFAVDEERGRLTLIGCEPTQGRTPRHFAVDPTGTFLLAANQDTSTVVTFRIDTPSGRLLKTGQTAEVPSPACVVVHAASS